MTRAGLTELGGLHHTSSITKDVVENARFYVGTLGLRLVYKGVNFDDPSMYHLAYGDGIGSYGTIMTFFDIPYAASNRPGSGSVSAIGLRVSDGDALRYWADRFDGEGVRHGGITERYDGRAMIAFSDPEGHRLQLVAEGGGVAISDGVRWDRSPVPAEAQVRGLESYAMTVGGAGPTRRTLVDLMDFREREEFDDAEGRKVVVFEVGPGGPGAEVHLMERPELGRERLGAGGVQHVAFRTTDEEEIGRWAGAVDRAGLRSSGLVDRFFAKSLYYREPNGILLELTTTDGGPSWISRMADLEHLGENLIIPPPLEDRRAEIEANLRPLHVEQFVGG